MPDAERRPIIETRSASVDNVDFGQRIITVIAVPYEQSAQVIYRGEIWDEIFMRSAFDGIETRQRRIPAVAALRVPDKEHDGKIVGKVIGADPSNTMGLLADVKVSRTPLGDETLELAADDALSASVGYMVKNPYRDQILDRSSKTRRIARAFLDHLAFVGVPAYEGARVLSVRSDGGDAGIPPARPLIDQFVEDPIFRWTSQRFNR